MTDTRSTYGRMVARDIHSLTDKAATATAHGDRLKAEQRVAQILSLPREDIVPVYIRMRHFLKESEATINFMAYKFFNSIPGGETYDNQFGGSSLKWGNAEYIANRNKAEEAMFDFAGLKRGGGNVAPKKVLDRIKKYGQFDTNSVNFEPIARPKYCALNFTRDPHGAGKQWGKSFLVVKEHVKHNCTYVESDSFDFTLSDTAVENGKLVKRSGFDTGHLHAATFFQLDRLFLFLAPAMIKRLYESMTNRPFSVEVGSTAYIEMHLHGDLRFDRDIARIVISKTEVSESKIKSAAKEFPAHLKEVTSSKVTSNIKAFAKKHGIPIEYTA